MLEKEKLKKGKYEMTQAVIFISILSDKEKKRVQKRSNKFFTKMLHGKLDFATCNANLIFTPQSYSKET